MILGRLHVRSILRQLADPQRRFSRPWLPRLLHLFLELVQKVLVWRAQWLLEVQLGGRTDDWEKAWNGRNVQLLEGDALRH